MRASSTERIRFPQPLFLDLPSASDEADSAAASGTSCLAAVVLSLRCSLVPSSGIPGFGGLSPLSSVPGSPSSSFWAGSFSAPASAESSSSLESVISAGSPAFPASASLSCDGIGSGASSAGSSAFSAEIFLPHRKQNIASSGSSRPQYGHLMHPSSPPQPGRTRTGSLPSAETRCFSIHSDTDMFP